MPNKTAKKVSPNLHNKLKHIESRQDTILKKLDEIGKQVGANQPKTKIKVAKTYIDDNGERRKSPDSPVVAKIRGKAHKNGRITTPQVDSLLRSNGYSRSRNSVLTLMRRMAEEFEDLKFSKSRKKKNAPYKLLSKR